MLLQKALFHSFFNGWIIFHCLCVCAPHLLYPFICQWTFRLLPYLGYCKQCCCEYWCACIFLELVFFLDLCPGMGLQGHIATPFFILWGTPVLFSTVAIPIYFPTSSTGSFPLLICFLIFERRSLNIHFSDSSMVSVNSIIPLAILWMLCLNITLPIAWFVGLLWLWEAYSMLDVRYVRLAIK